MPPPTTTCQKKEKQKRNRQRKSIEPNSLTNKSRAMVVNRVDAFFRGNRDKPKSRLVDFVFLNTLNMLW